MSEVAMGATTVPGGVEGPTVLVHEDLCKGCGLCIDVCPPGVLLQDTKLNHLGFHPVAYLGKWCNACGLCFFACPEPGALVVVRPGPARTNGSAPASGTGSAPSPSSGRRRHGR